LIVGILSKDGNIDWVVISSWIFIEDDTSQMQVDGIVNKVNTCMWLVLHLSVVSTS
jgi:hypothetical protein